MKNFLIGILVVAVIIFGYLAYKPKTEVTVSPTTTTPSGQATTINNPNGKDYQTNTSTSTKTPENTVWKTYSNATLGFSFQYPSSWKLTEDISKKSVNINTNDIGGVNPENRDDPSYPSWSITYTSTDKAYFNNNRISTNMGIITYDENLKALVDGNACLKIAPSNISATPSIFYDGSLMSDPAYSDSAILTSNGSIILVHGQQGTGVTPELKTQLEKIDSSFKLLNGNTVLVPECAK